MPKETPKPSHRPGATKPYFASVAVLVSDTSRSLEWYTEKLGLEVLDHEGHWVTVGRKGREGRLHLCRPADWDPNQPLEPGNSGIMLHLPGKDFARSCAELKERGVEFSVEPTTESWGTYAMVRDPDGNEHTLMPEH